MPTARNSTPVAVDNRRATAAAKVTVRATAVAAGKGIAGVGVPAAVVANSGAIAPDAEAADRGLSVPWTTATAAAKPTAT